MYKTKIQGDRLLMLALVIVIEISSRIYKPLVSIVASFFAQVLQAETCGLGIIHAVKNLNPKQIFMRNLHSQLIKHLGQGMRLESGYKAILVIVFSI